MVSVRISQENKKDEERKFKRLSLAMLCLTSRYLKGHAGDVSAVFN